MAEKSFDDLDDLQAQIRLRLAKMRQADPATTDELKDLLRQLEDWIDSLVVDSLKLKGLEDTAKAARSKAKKKLKTSGGG